MTSVATQLPAPVGLPAAPPSRVPEISIDFWLIKLMAVTMGETAADYLAVNLGLGLPLTSLIMTAVFAAALLVQFWRCRYVPWVYWTTVVLISIVGTLVTDNLVDNLGVSLIITTIVFSVALGVTFAIWYARERTLSIHTIFSFRREAFYWLAILFTFALGTSVGDLVAETLALGYLATGLLFGMVIAGIAIAWFALQVNPVAAFWLAYILTRPLGASFGDLLSQPVEYGGFGFGTVVTSLIFLGAIVGIVAYATVRQARRDATVTVC